MRRAFERMFSCVGSFFVMATTANRSEIRRAYLVSVIGNTLIVKWYFEFIYDSRRLDHIIRICG